VLRLSTECNVKTNRPQCIVVAIRQIVSVEQDLVETIVHSAMWMQLISIKYLKTLSSRVIFLELLHGSQFTASSLAGARPVRERPAFTCATVGVTTSCLPA
jgi:hypothetical protein